MAVGGAGRGLGGCWICKVPVDALPLAAAATVLCTLRGLVLRRQESGLLKTVVPLIDMRFRGNNVSVHRLTYLKVVVERFRFLQCQMPT